MLAAGFDAELSRAGANVSGRWSAALFLARRYPLGAIGGAIMGVFLLAALFAGILAPYDPLATNSAHSLARPGAAHWMGADNFGRDVLSRILHGARISLAVGIGSTLLGCLFGVILGLVSGGKMRVPGYAASKGGLHHLTRELAVQWARKGIRVNAIAPAWFETEMNTDGIFATEAGLKYINDGTPMGRSGREDELDGAAVFLASDASSYITGHILAVDGGWTAV